MAFAGATAAQVLRTAIGVITGSGLYSSAGAALTEGDYVRATMRSLVFDPPRAFQEYQGVVRTALALIRTGAPAVFGSNQPVPASGLPRDPSLGPTGTRYRYRLAVEIFNAYGGSVRTLARIDSDTPLTYQQLRDMIEADLEGTASPRRSVRQAIAALGADPVVSVTVVTAGRR